MSRLVHFAALLAYPPTLAHELTHWAVARLGTDDACIEVEVSDRSSTAAWPPLESKFLRIFAYMAPTVFGSILIGIWIATDQGIDGWRLVFALALANYTFPSPADLRGALGLQAVQQET